MSLVRYLTHIAGIELRTCLRIYSDMQSKTYWLVTCDSNWKETKKNIGHLEQEVYVLISYACNYNTACRNFILKNTGGICEPR